MSLLRFRPLPLVDKLRFAVSTLLLQRRSDPGPFESVRAAEWLRRHQGERAWQSVWRPLLVQKFGSRAEDVAMVWLWCKLRLRGTSRSRTGLGERLGYMRGSFERLVEALASRLQDAGGGLELGNDVRRIERIDERIDPAGTSGGRRWPRFRLHARKGSHDVDAVVIAAPVEEVLALAGELLGPGERERLGQLSSTGALCTVLELDRSLTPYYWLNVADVEMPFGGLIEHTNLVPSERYGGRHVLYISSYVFTSDPLFYMPRTRLLDLYYPALARINPAFDPGWVLAAHHFRASSAQPVVTCGYRDLIPGHRSSVPGLYLASMAQVYPEDRGQSYAVAHGEQVARCVIDDLEAAPG
jgi:protoporphyrinogen oxidase